MRFDRNRPVPWRRLLTEWAVIGVVIALVSWFSTDNHKVESYLSIILAGGIYVLFGALLAKLGYARKTLRQLRAEAATPTPARASTPTSRPRPAPTSRTSGGGNRPTRKRR
jgi:hypothetical protein